MQRAWTHRQGERLKVGERVFVKVGFGGNYAVIKAVTREGRYLVNWETPRGIPPLGAWPSGSVYIGSLLPQRRVKL